MILGVYVISGMNIYTLNQIDEPILIVTTIKGTQYTLTIDATTEKAISLAENNKLIVKDNSVMDHLINIIIKEAIRSTSLI